MSSPSGMHRHLLPDAETPLEVGPSVTSVFIAGKHFLIWMRCDHFKSYNPGELAQEITELEQGWGRRKERDNSSVWGMYLGGRMLKNKEIRVPHPTPHYPTLAEKANTGRVTSAVDVTQRTLANSLKASLLS